MEAYTATQLYTVLHMLAIVPGTKDIVMFEKETRFFVPRIMIHVSQHASTCKAVSRVRDKHRALTRSIAAIAR